MEPLPDLATLSDDDLKTLIERADPGGGRGLLQARLLQGRIDILRAERAARLKGKGVSDVDVEALTDILSSRSAPRAKRACEPRLLRGVRLPEPRGRELLLPLRRAPREGESGEQTMTFTPERVSEDPGAALQDLGGTGPALVVRAGGGGRARASSSSEQPDRPLARVTMSS